jgi:hypothetical protein
LVNGGLFRLLTAAHKKYIMNQTKEKGKKSEFKNQSQRKKREKTGIHFFVLFLPSVPAGY